MTHTIFKHDAIDIADPSSMQEVCHMNFVNRPRSPWSLYGSKVEYRSVDPEGLRFDSSWGLGMFSLSQTRDKTKKTSFPISLPSSKRTIFLILL